MNKRSFSTVHYNQLSLCHWQQIGAPLAIVETDIQKLLKPTVYDWAERLSTWLCFV